MELAGGGWDPSEKGSGCHSRALTPGTRAVFGEADESRGVGGEVTVCRMRECGRQAPGKAKVELWDCL